MVVAEKVSFVARGSAAILRIPDACEQPAGPPVRPPFASLGAAAAARPPVRERRTGVEFCPEFCYREGQRACPLLAGVGVRRKRLAGIKNLDVYALALYVAEAEARRELRGRPAGAAGQALLDELVKHDGIEKTLSIVITSGLVKRKSFMDALNERLSPVLEAARDPGALQAFQRQFDAAHFRKGLEISFTWTPGGELVTKIDGQKAGALRSKALAHALLDLYVGPDPVSREAKDSFRSGLEAMLR